MNSTPNWRRGNNLVPGPNSSSSTDDDAVVPRVPDSKARRTSAKCQKRTRLRQADLAQMPQGAIAKCLRIANPGSESYIDELALGRIF